MLQREGLLRAPEPRRELRGRRCGDTVPWTQCLPALAAEHAAHSRSG